MKGFARVMPKILEVLADNLPAYLGYVIMVPTIPNYGTMVFLKKLKSHKKSQQKKQTVSTLRYDIAPVELDACLGVQSMHGETSMHGWRQLFSSSGITWVPR